MTWSIEELIPQKAPFVFIDEVLTFSDDEISTGFMIKEGATLIANGQLQDAALIENIAQTAAALEGCNAKKRGEDVKIGFIGSVKKLKIERSALVGQKLFTTLKIVNNVLGVNIAEGAVYIDGELIASCTLNIFLKED